jgi:hypothetical protein
MFYNESNFIAASVLHEKGTGSLLTFDFQTSASQALNSRGVAWGKKMLSEDLGQNVSCAQYFNGKLRRAAYCKHWRI